MTSSIDIWMPSPRDDRLSTTERDLRSDAIGARQSRPSLEVVLKAYAKTSVVEPIGAENSIYRRPPSLAIRHGVARSRRISCRERLSSITRRSAPCLGAPLSVASGVDTDQHHSAICNTSCMAIARAAMAERDRVNRANTPAETHLFRRSDNSPEKHGAPPRRGPRR